METKYNILAVMGKAGSGKDTFVRKLLQEPQFQDAVPIISCTTRPIREHEQDGVNYHFLTKEEFTEQVLNGEMLEATVFNTWCYGTSLKNLDKNKLNIGVFNPEGIGILKENKNINLTIIYIQARDKDRLLRQLNREDNPDVHEIVRRFGADEKDFLPEEIDYLAPEYIFTNNNDTDINILVKTFAHIWSMGNIN